jgi:zinc protease
MTSAPVPEDPAIRRGRLANGLRYAVMHGAKPASGISIRLGIDVGSFQEADGARGVAHFIEHMAFRSTRAFPDNQVDGAFAGKGVTFGRDLNASTDLLATRFQIDLPTARPADVALAFTWLRNVADGVTFEATDVDKERSVVLAEKAARSNPQSLAAEAVGRFEGPGLRSTARPTIGDEADLLGATPQMLLGFYRRWYRPDEAVVVVVGDLPTATLEARVRETFGSWRAVGPAPARGPRDAPDPSRGLDTFVFGHAALLDSDVVCRLGPPSPAAGDTIAHVRLAALGEIWRAALNARLLALHDNPANRLLGASAEVEDNRADARAVCLRAFPVGGAWAEPLAAIHQELRRFASADPTPTEVETAIEAVRSRLRGAIGDAANRTDAALADAILSDELAGEPTPDPRAALTAFDLAIEGIGPAEVRAAFARDWQGAGPLVSVVSNTAPPADAVRAAWISGEAAAAPAAYADVAPATWGYEFGPPGAVDEREAVSPGDFVRIRFRNGVRLNLKQTRFEKDSVQLVLALGAGRRELPRADVLTATLAGAMLPYGGTGRHSVDEIHRLFPSGLLAFQLTVGDDAFVLGSRIQRANLADDLNILAAYFSDPGFRPSLDPAIQEAVNVTYRLLDSSPQLAAQMALIRAIAPDSVEILPPKAILDALDSARAAAVLKPPLTKDEIDVTLVGDIDEATAVRLVGSTFGALPPRVSPRPRRDDVQFLRFPQARPAPVRVIAAGAPDKAAVIAIWPAYVATASRRREERAIDLLALIFNDELRRRVRVELGKAYAPQVSAAMPDDADQGYIAAQIETGPADVEAMPTEMRAIAERLAKGEITQQQLEAVRAPLLARIEKGLSSNARWAGALSRSAVDARDLHDLMSDSDLIGSISLDEVRKAAATWLAPAPFLAIAAPAEHPATETPRENVKP